MLTPEYFDGFTKFRAYHIRKSKHEHFCCMCGATLTNRKVKLLGSPVNDPKKSQFATWQYFLCPSNSCWGEVQKRLPKSERRLTKGE